MNTLYRHGILYNHTAGHLRIKIIILNRTESRQCWVCLTCCINPTNNCMRNSCSRQWVTSKTKHACSHIYSTLLDHFLTLKITYLMNHSYHFKKSSQQEPFAYSRRPWEIELVAKSRCANKVIHVWRQKKIKIKTNQLAGTNITVIIYMNNVRV